jgi:hypothetical protein
MNFAKLRRRIQQNLGPPALLKLIGLVQWLNRCGVFGRGQRQEVDIRLGDDFDDLPGAVRDEFWADTLNESPQGIDETGEEAFRLHNLQEEGASNWWSIPTRY